MKIIREWTIDAPWGKIAMISWGSETGPPVLLVHGRQDSAATFEPLLQLLPATYHYVALDLPGNGRSDPLPTGVALARLHMVGAVQVALRHLRWQRFVYVGHSMGSEAVISWGSETGPPVLLVHGRQDSAATFEPLLQLLPATYHYVALDLPGNGRSDPLPTGVALARLHMVGAVQVALRHLRWQRFVYVGHSMGSEAALFFNAAYPGRIRKLVLLDPAPSLARLQVPSPEEYFASYYQFYYDNTDAFAQRRLYSERRALEAVMKARGFSEAQARLALARNLRRVGADLYELSWDRRLTHLAPPDYPRDYYLQLFSGAPPTLAVAARTWHVAHTKGKPAALKLIADLERNLDNFTVVTVEGGHDVHFTNPERFVKVLLEFLDKDKCKSKL